MTFHDLRQIAVPLFLASLLAGCCSAPVCEEAGENAKEFALVRENQAVCTVLHPEDAPKAVVSAVENFNETLEIITKTKLPVSKTDVPGNRIVLDVQPVTALKTADNFEITFPDDRTMRIGGTYDSVQWAFNHIIREFAKAEWILPETCGLSYTPMKDLTCPMEKVEVKNIAWAVSRIYNCGTLWPKMNYRMGLRIGHDLTVHTFPFEKYGKDNSWPKVILPVLNGKKITEVSDRWSHWQPCYSNPETAKIAVENLEEYLKTHPGTLGLSMGCNDNRGFCECAACMEMDKNRRNNRSESYFTFINRVLTEVCKKHPKLLVSVFAYDLTYLPPSFKLHPNAVVYLTIDINSCIDPKLHARHKELISEWGSKASMLGVWDYSWGYPYPIPRLYAPYHLDMLKFCYDNHAKGYYGECCVHDANEGPKQYLISKLLWNSNQDMEKVAEDWYVRCVGEKAAPHLKAYYKIWNDYFTGKVQSTPWFKSAPGIYMTYDDVSCVYALEESDIQAADAAMKQVVALAGTEQEKQRAEVMRRHWRQTFIRLRLLGAGVYDCKGLIHTPEQACALLETVLKSPEYLEEYGKISELLIQEKRLRGHYLSKYYLRNGGSPVGRNFDAALNGHLQATAEFAGHPQVKRMLERICEEKRLATSVRALCRLLRNPAAYRNHLPEGDAEQGVTDSFSACANTYWVRNDSPDLAKLSVSEDFAASGKRSFLLEPGFNSIAFRVHASGLTPGKKYVFSFKAFIEKPSEEGYIQAWCIGSKDAVYHRSEALTPFKLSGGVWQTFTVLSPVLASDELFIRIYLRSFSEGDKVYLDDLKLMEIGDEA